MIAQSYLAPMLGYTDNPSFLLSCKKYGCDVLVFPMIFAEGIIRNPDLIRKKLEFLTSRSLNRDFKPIIVQLISEDETYLKKALDILTSYDIDGVNLNLGCPSVKMKRLRVGGWLLEEKERRNSIVAAFSKHSSFPISVKMRLIGKSEPDVVETLKFCKYLDDFNLSWLAVHGRTTRQKYSGNVHWSVIKNIRDSISTPIIGNGDIKCVEEGDLLVINGYCDGIMIGRAALRDPRVFDAHYVEKFKVKNAQDVLKLYIELINFNKLLELDKIQTGMDIHAKKRWLINFSRGSKNGKAIRNLVSRIKDDKEFATIIEDLREAR
ncbi:MAG: tRNA-dihydrouridine synthase family protein [Promethearchaeota archaeon]